MPDRKTASLFHGTYYLQVLDGLNDSYLKGGEEQTAAFKRFDVEFPNLLSARRNIAELIADSIGEPEPSAKQLALLDVCNAFPDSGAYLIHAKIDATERINWLQDALQASRKLQNDVTTQAHLGNLGLAYYELGKPEQAIDYLSNALQVAEKNWR